MSSEPNPSIYELSHTAASLILKRLPKELENVKCAIVCGTGLGGITNELQEPIVSIPYEEIPNFRTSTVAGHAGRLVAGLLGPKKTPVICMAGRLHTYEGYDIEDTVFPIRVFAALKIEVLFVTNAAGGLCRDYKVGDLMLLNDHINFPGLAGLHPLKGPNDERFGPRFLALSEAYDHDLRAGFFKAADSIGVTRSIHEGTYAFVSGPTYETRAEVRMLSTMGADAVGMSTVPEIIVARHSGIRVLALSLITNVSVHDKISSARKPLATSLSEGMATHQEVIEAGNEAAKDVQAIIAELVGDI